VGTLKNRCICGDEKPPDSKVLELLTKSRIISSGRIGAALASTGSLSLSIMEVNPLVLQKIHRDKV
jgi:hypothetical protein